MKRALLLSTLAVLLVALTSDDVARAGPPCACGNGDPCGDEACDDGNTQSGDGCSYPSCLPEICGDHIVNPDPAPGPAEECDDGNTVDDDLCDNDCELNCGDGVQEGSEQCDEGGETPTCDDDCSAVECGDGNLNEAAAEECDDGNTVSGDGCEPDCLLEPPVPPPPDAQRCVNAVNKSFARLAKAQNADDARCVRAASAGDPLEVCLGADLSGKVARASERTARVFESRNCNQAEPPDFASTDAATVTAAAVDEMLASLERLLGAAPAVADRQLDPLGARCQREALVQHDRVVARWLLEANRAKKRLMKGSPAAPGVGTPSALAAGVDAALGTSAALARALAQVEPGLARRCEGAPLAALFACGAPASAAELAACVAESAQQAACQAFEAADALDLGCASPP
jgi:cysteine-rich repeat protein